MANYRNENCFEVRFNRGRRENFARWLDDPSYNIALTLNFNSPVSLTNARGAVGKLFGVVDRKLLGARFNKYTTGRVDGVFVFEHLDSNIHAHGLLKVNPISVERFASMFPENGRGPWSEIWKAGTQYLKLAYDPSGFAGYISKEQFASSAPETMLFLRDFYAKQG